MFTLRWVGEGIAEITENVDGSPVKIVDRAAAERLTNTRLFIARDRLPAPEPDEFYLADLIGLAAVDTAGVPLGVVAAVHDHGAGTSLEIARDAAESLLVPFTAVCVPTIDIAAGQLTVAPPAEVAVAPTPRIDPPPELAAPRHSPARARPNAVTGPPNNRANGDTVPTDAPRSNGDMEAAA